ncbi:MAG TPA: hypothetical protein VHH36_02020 [Candidatus Thermoplasmatota archaeon]|nr:hypothetical protein [Candidatus Thermoplasmatota archaeon]
MGREARRWGFIVAGVCLGLAFGLWTRDPGGATGATLWILMGLVSAGVVAAAAGFALGREKGPR